MALLLFRNEACLVVNKLPGESSEEPELDSTGEKFLAPVHRLDTPVSGCLLLARTREAAAFLGEAFARPLRSFDEAFGGKSNDLSGGGSSGADGIIKGRVEKRYWAIIEKPPAVLPSETLTSKSFPPEGELVHWIVENRKANKSFAFPFDAACANIPPVAHNRRKTAKKAVMRCRPAGQGERYIFLEIDLVTGRHHQIRAQLAALGLHIKGDLKYGARRSEKNGGIRLHAHSLAFPNPLNPQETISVKTLPPRMDNLWEAFCKMGQGSVVSNFFVLTSSQDR